MTAILRPKTALCDLLAPLVNVCLSDEESFDGEPEYVCLTPHVLVRVPEANDVIPMGDRWRHHDIWLCATLETAYHHEGEWVATYEITVDE